MSSSAAILRQISEDRALAARMCFPHRHSQESPDFHVELVDMMRTADEFVVLEVFREGGKTTISEEFVTMEALFGNFQYQLIVGETFTKACQRLDSIKGEIVGNQLLKTLFGAQKGDPWNEWFIRMKNGAVIQAVGWDQEHRGYLINGRRPDRVLLDDIENKTLVRDSAMVQEQMRRFWGELVPAMDKVTRRIRVNGTPLADDCMITRFKADPSFIVGRFPICDVSPDDLDNPQAKSIWPSRYSMEWIRNERDRFARNGMLAQFNQEYMLVSAQTQGKPFREEQLRFEAIEPWGWMPKKVIMDPARTTDVKKSDQTGAVVVSKQATRIYVHESRAEYWKPDQIIGGCFDMSARHGDAEVCVEKNSLDQWLLQPMRAEMIRRGQSLPLRPMLAPQVTSKDGFILGLQPFMEAGEIIFIGGREAHAVLIGQILNFPSGRKDVINALAYAPRVFGGNPVYEDFGIQNIESGLEPQRGAPLILGVHAEGDTIAACLVAIHGQAMVVLCDWISQLNAPDALSDISRLVRAGWPGHRVSAIVPADLFDQQLRNPVVRALKAQQLAVHRGAYAGQARGNLQPLIRTEMRGRRMLCVDREATHTCQSLAGGYCYAVGAGPNNGSPEVGGYRLMAEALECLAATLLTANRDALPEGVNMAVNPQGVEYMTALPRR